MDPESETIPDTDITGITDELQSHADAELGSDAVPVPEEEPQSREEPKKASKLKSILPPGTAEQNVAVDDTESMAEVATLQDGEEGRGAPVIASPDDFKQSKKAERKLRLREMEAKRFKVSDSRVSFDVVALSEGRLGDEDEDDDEAASFRAERKREEKLHQRHTLLLEDEYEEVVTRDAEHDEDSDSIDVEMSSINFVRNFDKASDTVQLKEEFLNEFDLPSLSDFSDEDSGQLEQFIRADSVHHIEEGDVGAFVDPLTGDVLVTSSSSSSDESHVEVEEEEQGAEEEPEECPEMTDDDLPEATLRHADESLHEFEKFRQTFESQELGEQPRESEVETRRHRTELMIITQDFLNDLIAALVNKFETMNVDQVLRARCDKSKLMEELISVTNSFYFEKLDNFFLQGRVAEYYKRNRNMRVFARLERDVDHSYNLRYVEALKQLDCIKSRFVAAKEKSSFLMNKVLMELYYTQTSASRSETHMDQTVRQYLSLQDSDYLKRLADRELKLMAVKRNEISDTRLFLITMKHTLGRVTDKINQLEHVGDDLYINDFIAIQNQVITLDKKIEERNIELKKLRSNYHVDLHLTQHNREKALELADKLQHCKSTLKGLLRKQHQMREKLYSVKMDRTRIRKQQQDLSYQGGILSMPSLMYEYDNTVAGLQAKRASVLKLRETLKNINRRIHEYESTAYSI